MKKYTSCSPVICLSETLFVPRQNEIAGGQRSVINFFFSTDLLPSEETTSIKVTSLHSLFLQNEVNSHMNRE